MSHLSVKAMNAIAHLTSHSGVYGTIHFEQQAPPGGYVTVKGDIHALPQGPHTFSVNTEGNISNGGFATGLVYRELESIEAVDGKAHVDQKFDKISLVPVATNCIVGKSLVVYATDITSDPIAWAVIGSLSPK